MANLPTGKNPPLWYTVNKEEKGWTPETGDIKNPEVEGAWNRDKTLLTNTEKPTLSISLKVISPIQVGGGSFPEGMILPAQIGGIPCIPGSSIRGAFLNYLLSKWNELPDREKTFFETLIDGQNRSWKPKVIRFENIPLNHLLPYPLNAQQDWQIFDKKKQDEKKDKKDKDDNKKNDFIGALSIQWQVSPKQPLSKETPEYSFIIMLKNKPTTKQETWIKTRLIEMFKQQGIGRGTAAGFGRLSDRDLPLTKWKIELTGMKPCIQAYNKAKNQKGEYRWSPQVLRATLRGYFTRLALSILDEKEAKQLTSHIFGGLGYPPSPLTLTSYLSEIKSGDITSGYYSNFPANEIHSTWIIKVDCSPEFKDLIENLLNLSSRLGGLGPGWRRPPHKMEKETKHGKIIYVFRGSEFTVSPIDTKQSLSILIQNVLTYMKNKAIHYKVVDNNHSFKLKKRKGSIISIWQGRSPKWHDDIVHGICRTSNKNRPPWCGDNESRPSGYAIREYKDRKYFLITVFDVEVEDELSKEEYKNNYRKIYSIS